MPPPARSIDIALGRLRFDRQRPVPWSDSVAVVALAWVCFRLLRQRALHGLDAPDFINWLQMGKASHHIHYLFMPLIDALHRVLRPFGSTPYETLVLASNVGGALGVGALHRAGVRLGLTRLDATLAALLVASAPAVAFFSTVAEIHGVFLAFAGLACWQWARCLRQPSLGAALGLGVATALAAAVHATGHLLVILLPALTIGLVGRRSRTLWRLLPIVLLAHAVASLGLDAALRRADVDVQRQGMIGFLWRCLIQLPLGWNLLGDVWREWLRPFLPLSLAPLVALAWRPTRRFAACFWLAAAAFLGITVVLLFGKLVERGAYELPLAWPAALLVLALLPRAGQVAALALSCGLATYDIVQHDKPFENPALIAGLRAAAAHEKLFVVCEDLTEWEPLLRDLPSVPSCPLFWIGQLVAQGYAGFTASLDARLDDQFAAGYAVVFSTRAQELLSTIPEPTIARFMREHVPERYTVEPYRAGAFTGMRWRRRP